MGNCHNRPPTVVATVATARCTITDQNGDDLVCAITLSLPVDPVKAEDGHVYEKEAIERYFSTTTTNDDGEIKSPLTRQTIGTNLSPAPQIKTAIETLIENGAIAGDLAEDWQKRFQQKKAMDDLLEKADLGSVGSMLEVAIRFQTGNGFKIDQKEAFKWYNKAARAGSVVGMAKVGDMLLVGDGVDQDEAEGLIWLCRAQGAGSNLAAFLLAVLRSEGRHGVRVDMVEALELVKKSLNGHCAYKHMTKETKQEARALLARLENQQQS